MKLTITPGYVYAPAAEKAADGTLVSMQGRTVAFQATFETADGAIDVTDKADWDSSNPMVLLPISKTPIYDQQGRIVGSRADFRLINEGAATITAVAHGLTAHANVAFGVGGPTKALAPVDLGVPASDAALWAGLGLAGFAFILGLFGAFSRGGDDAA